MDCAPCPCDLLGIKDPLECQDIVTIFSYPPRLGQLYTTGYTLTTHLSTILNGVETDAQQAISNWIFRLGLAFVLPYVVMFIIVAIVLANKGIIDWDTAYMLIALTIIFSIIGALFVIWDTSFLVENVINAISIRIVTNWEENGDLIIRDLVDSYAQCNYCRSTTGGCPENCGGICTNGCGL